MINISEYKKIMIKITKAEETLSFLKDYKINSVFPMSIYRIRLPVRSKKVLQNTKVICLQAAISDAKNRFFALQKQATQVRTRIDSGLNECLMNQLTHLDHFIFSFKLSLRKKHIKKIRWIFQKQLRQKYKQALPLEEVLTVIDDIELPRFVEEVIQIGPACAITKHADLVQDVPALERVLQPLDDLEAEHFRWAFPAEHRKRKSSAEKSSQSTTHLNHARIRRILRWFEDNNIVITWDDKSKKLVMLKKKLMITL